MPLGAHPSSSLRYPSDSVPEKPGTDVLLLGTAQPPAGAEVSARDVTLRLERRPQPLEKTVTVYGPRIYYRALTGVVPGPPAALGPTPLVYELAYGGCDGPFSEPRNPAGMGFARDPSSLVGQRAPQLEDPRAPLTTTRCRWWPPTRRARSSATTASRSGRRRRSPARARWTR